MGNFCFVFWFFLGGGIIMLTKTAVDDSQQVGKIQRLPLSTCLKWTTKNA